jgi:hypothetical protein
MKRDGRGEPPYSTTATTRRIARHALALAVFVALSASVPVAQGAPEQGLTPAAQQMERHFQHEDALYQLVAQGAPEQGLTPAAQQLERHFQHEDALYQSSERAASSPVAQGAPLASTDTGNGFDWGDAGIGFATAIGAMLLAAASAIRLLKRGRLMFHRTIRKRQQLARHVERAAVPERPFIGRGPRYLVEPGVAAACAPSLRAIAAALRDETHPIDEASLKAVGTFLTDGSGPFFGQDSTAALREAVRLQHVVVGAETAVFDEERVAVAV